MDTQLSEIEIADDINILDSLVWNDDFLSNISNECEYGIHGNDEGKEVAQTFEASLPVSEPNEVQNLSNTVGVQFHLPQSLFAQWNAQLVISSTTNQEDEVAQLEDWNSIDNFLEQFETQNTCLQGGHNS